MIKSDLSIYDELQLRELPIAVSFINIFSFLKSLKNRFIGKNRYLVFLRTLANVFYYLRKFLIDGISYFNIANIKKIGIYQMIRQK